MSRVVVVSNRVTDPRRGRATGGLAVGVLAALESRGGLWFGWNGRLSAAEAPELEMVQAGNMAYARIPLPERDFDAYYNGFCNATLWPVFHYLLGFFQYQRGQYESYLRINRLFARHLVPLLEPDDLIWVHDYHLIPLAAELRQAGCRQPMGFFLHTPFPRYDLLRTLPPSADLLRSLFCYDVVGFQTAWDLDAFRECVRQDAVGAEVVDARTLRLGDRSVHVAVFPIGIDVEGCQQAAGATQNSAMIRKTVESLVGRQLIFGVDRLDYSKGLPEKFRAYEILLEKHVERRRNVVFMQIAPPTRVGVRAYAEIREELEQCAGHINGRFAETDWVAIRYLNQGCARDKLMGLMRLARVGLVTPIRDGMNLVAKEYVAAQDPENPGVLVLSELAGAARELREAVLVNPYDVEGVAEAIHAALDMPLEERRRRHQAMLDVLRRNDIDHWRRRFLGALTRVDGGP